MTRRLAAPVVEPVGAVAVAVASAGTDPSNSGVAVGAVDWALAA
jgi:hypothetical protein